MNDDSIRLNAGRMAIIAGTPAFEAQDEQTDAITAIVNILLAVHEDMPSAQPRGIMDLALAAFEVETQGESEYELEYSVRLDQRRRRKPQSG